MPAFVDRHGFCSASAFPIILKTELNTMRKTLITAAMLGLASMGAVRAQTDLSAYMDANGYLDVQKLTCAQLAGTWQQDADMLTTWYSGWYNGLAHKHMLNVARAKEAEHEVIVYCKANPDKKIIEAIAVVFKDMRAALGIKMKP
jgi:hypothetical protein